MERRGFLKALAGALAVAGVVKATPVVSAPVAPAQTMTALSIRHAHEREVWMGRHYDYIVSPKQAEALESLYGKFQSAVEASGEPLSYGLIERMEKMYR